MRIGIDGLHLFGNYAGINGSLAGLVTALRIHFPADEIVLYVPRDFKGPPQTAGDSGLILRRAWFPGRWRSIRTLWRNFHLQSRTYADRCDLLHGPTYALPAMLSKPAVVTVHDMIAFTHPAFCTPGSARLQKQTIPRSVKVARRVIAPSAACKETILRNLKGVSEAHIDVIPWGVGAEFKPLAGDFERRQARVLLNEIIARSAQQGKPKSSHSTVLESLPEQYVLFVGNLEPKKNIPTLIKSFFAARVHRKLPHKLVLAGQSGWGRLDLERLIRDLDAQKYIVFTGYVPQPVLPLMYALAELFVMPSWIEGFGMPVLEAMACGCPVAISADPALVENAGGAAHIAPWNSEKPFQPLREAIEELLADNSQPRKELIQRGLEHAKSFSWERTARLTREAYEKALNDE